MYVFLLLCIFRTGCSVSLCSVYCLCVNVLLPTGVNPFAVNKCIIPYLKLKRRDISLPTLDRFHCITREFVQ